MKKSTKITIAMLGKLVAEENEDKVRMKTTKRFIFSQPYVNYIYLSGADVYPISTTASREEIRDILSQVNGVLLPGGMSNVFRSVPDPAEPTKKVQVWSEFTKATKIIMEEAAALNDRGVYFPVFGICLGFEAMIAVAADDTGVIEYCGDKCIMYNARLFYDQKKKDSRLLSAFPDEILEYLAATNCTQNYHEYKVDKERMLRDKRVASLYKVVSLSPARDGSFNFVSMIEGVKYPFYAYQFHPEQGPKAYVPPEWVKYPDINKAAEISFVLINFMRSEAQKNGHSIRDEGKLLINSPGTLEIGSFGIMYYTWGS